MDLQRYLNFPPISLKLPHTCEIIIYSYEHNFDFAETVDLYTLFAIPIRKILKTVIATSILYNYAHCSNMRKSMNGRIGIAQYQP